MNRRPLAWWTALLLIAGVQIAYEVALTRILSIGQWHHFAYMVISLAMLGFAASGTALSLLGSRLAGREPGLLRLTAFLVALSLPASYAASQAVPFETFQLVADPRQWVWLLLLYLILAVPFFLVSTAIALAFYLEPRRVGAVYFVTMVGSGLGAAGVVGLMYLAPPETLPGWLCLPAAGAFVLLPAGSPGRRWSTPVGLAILVAAALWLGRAPLRISEYKGLSYALGLPDAEVVARRASPLSVITAVKSPQIRETPGQLGAYPMSELGRLPEQIGLFFDAGAVSVVNRFDGSLEPFAYLDYVTPAVAYHLLDHPRVAVLGAGGGTNVLMALAHGAEQVTAVEVDPRVFALIADEFGSFSGGLYQRPDVTPRIAEGRAFLRATPERYDLIEIALLDSFAASSAGVYALSESYLYTVEALREYLDRLAPEGLLSISRWLKTPARDAIKMFATVVAACEAAGIEEPARHIAFIRTWNVGTILVSQSPLGPDHQAAIRGFCEARGFDLCWLPGIQPNEVNRYSVLPEPVYYQAARAILSGGREALYRDYAFDVRPATDDRPYFFRFFRWSAVGVLRSQLGSGWFRIVEWGYLALAATVVQSVLACSLLILLPLIVLRRRVANPGARRWVMRYFAALGFAYMFLEIAMIQKFMLFLAFPVYAVAVVLTSFLVFSGIGSAYADRRRGGYRMVRAAVLGIAVCVAVYLVALPPIFRSFAAAPDMARILFSIALLAPLAFCMGVPFPVGFQEVSDEYPDLLPWAWGINGGASVVAATLASLTAIHGGFRVVIALGVGAYVLAIRARRPGSAA